MQRRVDDGGPIYDASITNNVVPELDLTYFITKHWAVEAICRLTHHTLEGSLTPFGIKHNIANTTLFPPTATLQYHFALGQWDPYVGVGANYTWFFETKSQLTRRWASAITPSSLISAGVALQRRRGLLPDQALGPERRRQISGPGHQRQRPSRHQTVHVNIDPWLVRLGVGYRFGVADLFGARSSPSTDFSLIVRFNESPVARPGFFVFHCRNKTSLRKAEACVRKSSNPLSGGAARKASNSPRPSVPPTSGSIRFSGCGIMPSTLKFSE